MNDLTFSILIILTSNAQMGELGKPTGLWVEELAVPYYVLADAGVKITLASPKGGAAPLDPASVQPTGQNDMATERFLADAVLQRAVAHTVKLSEVDSTRFDAVFFPGGHGTMWDLPGDPDVSRAVERAWTAGKFVSSVCHGAAGLVGARRPDGQPIVAGLRVNSFTDAEERAVGLDGIVPFLLESRLRDLGARFDGGPAWQAYAVRDGQLVTGQNPQSSHLVAEQLLKALGR